MRVRNRQRRAKEPQRSERRFAATAPRARYYFSMNPTAQAQSDPFAQFKQKQREGWSHFHPLAAMTTPCAAKLVNFAGVKSGQRVLDVACGTGVVAVTCARRGARVSALDLTPELLETARENAQLGGVEIDFHEGDAEQLPFSDSE